MPILSTETSVQLRKILDQIVPDRLLHAKWLNTLSYMEHVGATKIARTQSGPQATFMTLKHAAEEARHGFYLKKLAHRLDPKGIPNYEAAYLLAPVASHQFLYRLDLQASRLCYKAGLKGKELRSLAYLLVTYAIEVRADELYEVYQSYLGDYKVAKLSVQGIINEEEGHLAEMESELAKYPEEIRALTVPMLALENALYAKWLTAIGQEVLPN